MKTALLVSCVIFTLQATAPRNATAPLQSTATGTIRGTIVAADTGEPLHRVRVTLGSAPDAPGSVTDTRGEYEIADVPPGSYKLAASRAGYLRIQYGQRYPREAGRTIEVRAGETIAGIDLALPRWGVIAGTVHDELGELYANVTVEAVELRYLRGRRVPVQAASARTNDLGQFRIAGLQPGTYLLRASSTDTWQDDEGTATLTYAHTYFPGVTDRAEAQTVSVSVGQQVSGVSFAMRAVAASRIRGVMRDAVGNLLAGQVVHLSRITRGAGGALVSSGAGAPDVRTDKTGRFEFAALAPGEYNVSTPGSASPVETVVLTGGDVSDVVLAENKPAAVAGVVVTEPDAKLPVNASQLRVVPISTDPNLLFTPWHSPREASVTRDGTFRVTNVNGPYIFRLTGLPDDWMLAGVMLNGRNYIDSPLDIVAGVDTSGLRLVVTNAGAMITGTVVTRDGTPAPDSTVIVFPPESGRWTIASRFIKAVRPDQDGRFTVAGLPPGAYRVAAREFVADGQWEDPEFLTSLVATAARAQLAEGESVTMTITVERQP